MTKNCFLCKRNGSVIDFNDKSFEHCVLKLLFRQLKGFKYSDVKLTKDLIKVVGYHSSCYKKVTALKNIYNEEFNVFVKNHQAHSSASTSNEHPKSATSNPTTSVEKEDSGDIATLPLDNNNEVPSTETASTSQQPHDDCTSATPVAPVTPVTPITCIFCNCKQKKCGKILLNLVYPQSDQTVNYLQEIADQLHDLDISQKLKNQTVAYHKSCYATYQTNAKRSLEEPGDSSWQQYRHLHKLAFESLCDFVDTEIMKNNNVIYFAQLFKRYQALLLEFGENTLTFDDLKDYRKEMLEKKLKKKYGDRIFIEASTEPYNKKIIYNSDIEVSLLVQKIQSLCQSNDKKHDDVAYKLRSCIKQINQSPLPSKLTADDVIRGECDIPHELFTFMQNLINGPNITDKDSIENKLKVESICSDIIYVVSNGRCKPAKNITLGLAMKSLTNSRQVVTILNRYGHTIGYNLAEELETEMTYTSVEDNNIIPTGINAINGCSTHVAFDNFDRFVDTTSGKDTMHDTVGIIYQFPQTGAASPTSLAEYPCAETVNMETTASTSLLDQDTSDQGPVRKRRRFDGISRDVQPYFGRPKITIELLPLDLFNREIDVCTGATEIAVDKDLLWIMSLSQIEHVPMWLGYNSMISTDLSEIQKIEYLPQINSSPTSYAIVNETLKISCEIAEKCHQNDIIVTYDLAIAKMAMQIQEKEKPKFDHIFINLGAFHMQMAFFKAIGKYIVSSGLIEVLITAGVLAPGSANSFLDSKHFNRCKRLHPLTSAALQIFHFKRFLSTTNVSVEMLSELLQTLLEEKSSEPQSDVNERMELPDLLNHILNGYKEFCSQTLTGNFGKTAQFYYQYCEFINLFLRFSRSIRTSNFELYLDSISNMCNLFFALNQPNYARWGILYLSNLVRLQTEKSPLVTEFRRGAFGIRRTKASFARSPVDLTLEQTINADASNQLSDNLSADSISARQRWALSHSIRTKILSYIKNNVGLSQKDDTSHSLRKNIIQKDKKCLQSIMEVIQNMMNPFDDTIDKNILFNISTGKAASDEVTNFLCNVNNIGNQQKLNFITQCNSDPERFDKPIARNKLLNFASECATKTLSNKDKSKKVLVRMERDIFGRLLAVSIDKKIKIEHCLTYPLAPMPPALFSCSGDMFKTDKSTLAKTIKSQVEMAEPTTIDVEIIDGFFYLHLLGSTMPHTFEKIAESILIKLCSSRANEIHLIFDRYFSPSIKDSERQHRQEFDISFKISGPQQTRPPDFLKSLKNYRFKEALIQFLADYWENDYLVKVINNKKIYLTVDEHCYSYQTQQNRVIKTKENDYQCFHEEADTRMIFHAHMAAKGSNILIKSADTDVLIILLGNMHKIQDSQVWLASSLTKKKNSNDLNCINCTELASKLGSDLCLSLPAFHAYTGSDYTAAFFNKGKLRPYKLFSKNKTYQKCFASLTDEADIFINDKMDLIQEFTSAMYGIKNCNKVNYARYQIFVKNFSAKEDNEKFLKKVKSFDSNTIPPCWESLKQKILRTIYVNSMWLHATDPNCVKLNPHNCGWFLDGYLKPKGFDGDQTPLRINDILDMTEKENNETFSDLDTDTTSGDSDPE